MWMAVLAPLLLFGVVYCGFVISEVRLRVPVLMYHAVVPDSMTANRNDLPVTEFAKQLDYLIDAGYTPLTVTAWLTGARVGALPERPILITFDDGTEDHYRLAFPQLEDRRIAATFFVISGAVGADGFANYSQLREMRRGGMVVGSHTHNHPYAPSLRELPTSVIVDELATSKALLEDSLGVPVTTLGIPGGWYDERTLRVARDLGYTSVFTSDVGRNPVMPELAINRLEVDGRWGLRRFIVSLSPAAIASARLGQGVKRLGYRLIGPRRYRLLGTTYRPMVSNVAKVLGVLSAFALVFGVFLVVKRRVAVQGSDRS